MLWFCIREIQIFLFLIQFTFSIGLKNGLEAITEDFDGHLIQSSVLAICFNLQTGHKL